MEALTPPATAAPDGIEAQEGPWRARAVQFAFVALGLLVALPGIPSSISSGATWVTAALVVAAPLLLAGALFGGGQRHHRAWAGLLLSLLYAVPTVGLAQLGPYPGWAVAQAAFVTLCGVLAGPGAVWVALLLEVAAYAVILVGGRLGWLPWPTAPAVNWQATITWVRFLANFAALTLVTCVPALLVMRRYRRFLAGRAGARRRVEEAIASREVALARRREAEVAFAAAQRGQVVQRVGAALAHEFNNALVVIRCSAEALSDPAAGPAEKAEASDAILATARRATSLTRQIMMLARRQPAAAHATDVRRLLEALSPLCRQLLPADVAVEVRAAPGLHAAIDEGALHQALLNLVLNARDAMPHGGRLRLLAESRPAEGGAGAGQVVLQVTDEGTGLTPEVQERAFEPFFTTKPQGAGLGLASTAALVRQAGGEVALRSREGQGTTVILTVPAALPEVSAGGAPAGALRVAGARALLVDPDERLRRVTALALSARGFAVLEAADAPAGVERLRRLRDQLHLLCFDASEFTPGADRLAAECASLFPGAALLATGAVRPASLPPAAGFLAKPFVAGELASLAVAQVNAAGAPP